MRAQPEAIEALKRLDFALESKRLLVHAICESRRYSWRSGAGAMPHSDGHQEILAQGKSPVDIVQQAIALTLEGTRPWDKEKYPAIANHLKWVIRSLLSNLASCSDNRQLRHVPETPAEDGRWDLPETRSLREASGLEAQELSRRVLAAVEDDSQLVEALSLLQEGRKPAEIAEIMNLSDKDVYRLTQKLRRRLAPVLGGGRKDER